MRAIEKDLEPVSFTTYRSQPGAKYNDMDRQAKDSLRQHLLNEQGYICAYCMSRISFDFMKIEHWHCQSKYPEQQLSYSNLLACCHGNEHHLPLEQHCDTRKRERDIQFNPANPEHHDRLKIYYLGNGVICSDDDSFDKELNEILNLNWRRLKDNRKDIISAVDYVLKRQSSKPVKSKIRKLILKYSMKDDKGYLDEYCDVALHYLRKLLKRA